MFRGAGPSGGNPQSHRESKRRRFLSFMKKRGGLSVSEERTEGGDKHDITFLRRESEVGG